MFLILCSLMGFGQAWDINGSLVSEGKNKLGSLNDENVVFITNDIERMRLLKTGYFGINTSSPTTYLDVNGQIRLPNIKRKSNEKNHNIYSNNIFKYNGIFPKRKDYCTRSNNC